MRIIAVFLLCLFGSLVSAQDNVRLQLRWKHQFQFAGYYVAKEYGYYREAGIEVDIIQNGPAQRYNAIQRVLEGEADFGVSNSGLIVAYGQGEPVVALASIMQHSPATWIVTDPSIHTLHDLVGKRLMAILPVTESVEHFAPFLKEGIPLERLRMLPTSFSVDSLLNDETDAMNAYLSNEPFLLRQRGIPYRTIQPRSYGIDFYSDVLFTRASLVQDKPDLVERFLKASLRGWEEAVRDRSEVVKLIHEKYAPEKSIEHLTFEANTLIELMSADLVQVGHMNPGRWDHIAETFAKFDLIPEDLDLRGFLYDPNRTEVPFERYWLPFLATSLGGLIALGFLLRLYHLNQRLHQEVLRREEVEAKLTRQALIDPLTGVPNRRSFYQRAAAEHARFLRYQQCYAMVVLDVDWFKQINDEHGHLIGDRVLMEIAQRLQGLCRTSDFLARFGGEEFVILLPSVSEQDALQMAERLCSVIRDKPMQLSEEAFRPVTISVGVALAYPHDPVFEHVLDRADRALYQAKSDGRDRVHLDDSFGPRPHKAPQAQRSLDDQ